MFQVVHVVLVPVREWFNRSKQVGLGLGLVGARALLSWRCDLYKKGGYFALPAVPAGVLCCAFQTKHKACSDRDAETLFTAPRCGLAAACIQSHHLPGCIYGVQQDHVLHPVFLVRPHRSVVADPE